MIPVHTPVDRDTLAAMSVLELAHVGDAVYELLVRTQLVRQGAMKLSERHRRTIAYVAAPAQAAAAERILPQLTEQEHRTYRRGRNARVHACPSGCTMAEYHAATALEALFGELWLTGRAARCEELFGMIWEGDDAS